MDKIPLIKCPVYGVFKRYSLYISDSADSQEFKYRLYGALYLDEGPEEVYVLSMSVSTDDPNHIHIFYTKKDGDGLVEHTFANGIVKIGDDSKELVNRFNRTAEFSSGDTLRGLHHGNLLFIRDNNKKTYYWKAQGLSKTVRGNAYYTIFDAKRTDGGLLSFTVASDSHPDIKFEITAQTVKQGQWHKEPGTLCPVPGPHPDEA